MRAAKFLLYFLCLVSLCFLGACKMTEEQIRSAPPGLLNPSSQTSLVETRTDATPKRMPIGLIFAGVVLLIGTIIYLKTDQTVPLKPIQPRKKAKSTSKSRKKS